MSEDLQLRIRISADGRAAIEGMRQVESQVDHLGAAAKQVGGMIAAYLSFEILSAAVQALFQAGAALQDFQTRFQALAGSQQAAAAQLEYVAQAAQKMGLDLGAARESYAQLLAQQQAGVITTRQARDLLEGFGRAAQMTGIGAEQVKQSMLGLSQALSSGTVSTEDFRQAVDPLPGLMKHVADAMNVSIGELRDRLANGKIGSADFAQAMVKGLQAAGKGAQDFGTGLSATWQRVKNDWTLLLEAFGAADFLSVLEHSSFNDMAAAILGTLEQTLKDASAFIRSGWLSDALSAELTYIGGFLADAGDAVARLFDDVAQRAKIGWAAFTEPMRPQLDALQKNFLKVFADLPEYVASFTVIAASSIDQWIIDANAGWEQLKIDFAAAWDAMQGSLNQILPDMTAAVATAAARMAVNFTDAVASMARAVAEIPGVGDVMVGIVRKLGEARAAAVDWALSAQRAAADVKAANEGVAADYAAQRKAVRDAADQQKKASEAAAQQTVLEQHARTDARDAALAQAQAARQAADEAGKGLAGITETLRVQSAQIAKNAEEWAKYVKALKDRDFGAGMNPVEQAAQEAGRLGQGLWAQKEGEALARLATAYKDYTEALAAHNVAAAEAARQKALDADASLQNATRLAAEEAAWSQLGERVKAGAMSYAQAEAAARAAGNAAVANLQKQEQGATAMETVGRLQRDYDEGQQKAAQKASQSLQENIDLLQLQQKLLSGGGADQQRAYMSDMMERFHLTAEQAADAIVKAERATQTLTGDLKEQVYQRTIYNEIEQSSAKFQERQTAYLRETSKELQHQNDLARMRATMQADLLKDGYSTAGGNFGDLQFKVKIENQGQVEKVLALFKDLYAEMDKIKDMGGSDDMVNAMAARKIAEFDQQALDRIRGLTQGLKEQAAQLAAAAPSWSELTGAMDDGNRVRETAAALGREVVLGMTAEAAAAKDAAIGQAAHTDATQRYIAIAKEAAGYYKDALSPMEKYGEQIKRIDDIERDARQHKEEFMRVNKMSEQQWEQFLKGLDAGRIKAAQTAAAADPMAKAFQQAAENIYNAWSGLFESLFTGATDSFRAFAAQIETLFLKLLAQLAAAALAKPILLPVIQLLGGSIGLGQGEIAAVANNLFGAGSMAPGASGIGGVGNIGSLLSSGFGLFGGGGIGSLVGGAIGGLGSLLGGAFGAGLSAGGSLMSGMGLLSGGASALGVATNGMVGAGVSAGMIASTVIPVVGAVVAALIASGVFDKTPHPSSVAIAGVQTEGSGSHVGYRGKGDWIVGDSGMGFGYAYGHADPKGAQELRDGLMKIDAALAQIIPTADMADVALGQYGQTAEGFIAGLQNADDSSWRYVDSMDEVMAWFVKDWVEAAAAQGAVSTQINTVIQAMAGSAEDLMKGLGGLLQVGAYVAADPLRDFETALASANQTASQALAAMRQNLGDLARAFDGTSAHAEQLGAASAQLYQAELAMIEHIRGLVQGLAGTFGDSIEQIRLGLMSDTEKFDYYMQQAQAAQQAMAEATDPDQIARLAEQARQAAMEAYQLATAALGPDATDEQRAALAQQFTDFLAATQQQATDQLDAAEQQVVDQHRETAQILQDALQEAADAAAQALEEAGKTAASAIGSAADVMAAALAAALSAGTPRTGAADAAGGMAEGGWVGGRWNGQSGIAGDTVLTALTPGEAVIPRAQAQRHAHLINSLIRDDVRYAATGVATPETPEPMDSQINTAARGGGGGSGASPEDLAAQLADFMQGIGRALRDLSATDYAKQINGINDALADNLKRAAELGASEEQLAAIRELAQKQIEALDAQRAADLADLMRSYEDAAAGYTPLQQALLDNQRQIDAAVEKAKGLGASEEQLALIRAQGERAAQKLQDQQAANLADLMQRYEDAAAGYTPLQQALLDNQRQTDKAVEQAKGLGASEEQLALIREVGAQNAQQLQDQQAAQLADLMRSYEDAAAGYTPLQQALLDNQRQIDAAVEKAQGLGASEEQLALIRAQGAKKAADLAAAEQQKIDDFNAGMADQLAAFDRGDAEQALADLQKWYDDQRRQAEDLGADVTQIDALYARKRIDLAERAQQEALQAYREGVAEAIRLHDELTAAITQTRQSGAQAMLGIRRQQPGWNEAAYQAGEVEDLRKRLRAETDPTKQVELIRQLQEAIGARYQAEVEAINATSSASQTKSDLEIRNAERTRAIVENIRKYLDGLNLSQLSPLTPTQRLNEAAQQYQALLARAQAGDATAGDQITQAADAYLQEARSYYASSGAYTAIFDQIRQQLESLAGVSFADPVQTEAEYRATTVDLQTQSVDLQAQIADAQASALSELAALDDVLTSLQDDADSQLTDTIAGLEETLHEETDRNIAAIAEQSDKNAAAVTAALERLGADNETALQDNATAVAASMGTIMTALLDQLIERINANGARQADTRRVA